MSLDHSMEQGYSGSSNPEKQETSVPHSDEKVITEFDTPLTEAVDRGLVGPTPETPESLVSSQDTGVTSSEQPPYVPPETAVDTDDKKPNHARRWVAAITVGVIAIASVVTGVLAGSSGSKNKADALRDGTRPAATAAPFAPSNSEAPTTTEPFYEKFATETKPVSIYDLKLPVATSDTTIQQLLDIYAYNTALASNGFMDTGVEDQQLASYIWSSNAVNAGVNILDNQNQLAMGQKEAHPNTKGEEYYINVQLISGSLDNNTGTGTADAIITTGVHGYNTDEEEVIINFVIQSIDAPTLGSNGPLVPAKLWLVDQAKTIRTIQNTVNGY